MIYLFHGNDVQKVRTKAFEWIGKARAKEPNLAYVRLAREDLTEAALLEAASVGGLLISRLLVLVDDPFPATHIDRDDSDVSEDVVRPTPNVGRTTSNTSNLVEEHLDVLATSDNAIVILAPKLLAAKAKKLAAKAKIEYICDLPARTEATRGFNNALVHALATRAPERLWLEMVRALRQGDSPEMLHGLLHWKARDLMEKGSHTWSPSDARELSLDLIELLMDSRRKGCDLAFSLERFALSI